MANGTTYVPPTSGEVFSELGEGGKCKNESHIPVFIDGKKVGCGSASFFKDYYVAGAGVDSVPFIQGTADQIYSMLYGELPDGEYYETGDLNGDGVNEVYSYTFDDIGLKVNQTVYGYDNDGNVTQTPYDEWSAPDLTELIEKYGEDVVNDLKGKYDELVDFIGNIPEDPLGSLKKMAEIFIEGATGIPPECQKVSGGPLDEWYKNCVTVGILIEIGIPGLPSGIGGIFKGATIGEIEEALKKIGKKFEDIVNGTPTCGEDGKQECTPENILGDLAREVIDSIGSIFEDAEGNITVESVLGKLGGIFGSVLGGIIYDQFKDLINEEIENVIGIPVIPFAPLQECEDKGLVTIEDPAGSGNFKCGTKCKQEGFTPTGPQGECVDPNAVDAFDETKCVEETYFNENKADCEAAGYVNCEGGENSQAQETTGGIIKGTLDDCNVIQDPQCIGDGSWDGEKCVCPDGTDKAGEEEPLDGDCSDEEDPTEDTENECTKQGKVLHKGDCYDVNDMCFADPGEGCMVGSIQPDGSCKCDPYESCPAGSEVETPQYNANDVTKSGSFTLDGKEYTYEPCNPSLAPVEVVAPEQTCDNNAVNYPDCNQCENGEHPDAHVDSDCSKPPKETGTNPGDACDLGNNEVGVVDKNGDCKRVGQNCRRSKYGYTSSDNCDTGLGFNTSSGIIDSSGDCVCNTVCDDPNRRVHSTTGACRDDCKSGWKKDAEGNCTVEITDFECDNGATKESDCNECPKGQKFGTFYPKRCIPTQECIAEDAYTDPTKAEECGKVACPPDSEKPYADSLDQCVEVVTEEPCEQINPATGQPSPKDDQGNCYDCTDEANALVCGWAECPDGISMAPTLEDCGGTVPPETCSDPNAVNDGQEGPCECKPGFSKDPETLLCVRGVESCDNGATVESGCDICPDGSNVLEHEDGMCPSEPPQECTNGATDYPDCTVCPEGQSMDSEGNCTDCSDCSCAEYAAANPEECITEPPVEPPETGGGGNQGGGGGNMFDPFIAGISYTKQAVPEPPAPPQKDYMAELDNLIKRSLFEGMA